MQVRELQIHPHLMAWTNVFILEKILHKALQQPFGGPFKLLKLSEPFSVLDYEGRNETVCIDRLKAVFVQGTTTITAQKITASTLPI